MIKKTTKITIKGIKTVVKTSIKAIKAIIQSAKALISFLIAGGWVAVVIIILICLIALLCSSMYGIFFSSEDTGNKTMSSVISDINMEFTNRINEIQNTNEHDEFEINSNKAEWKDVLSIYVPLITQGKEQADVITIDDNKINLLKSIFWEMNQIDYRVDEVEKGVEIIDENGNKAIVNMQRRVLYINISSISVEEMANRYNFNGKQREQLKELQKEEYSSLWSAVIYGRTGDNSDIVQIALAQIGNVGGQPYWSWYGFTSRVEWCACFVSYCANECGYIERGIVPKFSSCQSEGVAWFKVCDLWKDGGCIASSGDIIFFDWDNDGKANHVGIVEKVENNKVYTIEGNTTGDVCKQNIYDINSNVILGYGIIRNN